MNHSHMITTKSGEVVEYIDIVTPEQLKAQDREEAGDILWGFAVTLIWGFIGLVIWANLFAPRVF